MSNALPFAAGWGWVTSLWWVAVWAAVAVAVLVAAHTLLKLALPKIAAIAWTTARETLQPLFFLVILIGIFLLVLFTVLPYNTFGEDIKTFKDTGLKLIMILAIFLACWTASVSIAEEIEGRTALTLLSKPISRASYVLGKFLGIIGPVAIVFIVLGVCFLCLVPFKISYDASEGSLPDPDSQQCIQSMEKIAPGLVLAFLEAVALTSISVAISTRLSKIPNLLICFAVYYLGHWVPMVVNSAEGAYGIVPFLGQLLATILPVLDHFDIYGAIAKDQAVPLSYVLWTSLYCLLYSSVAMLFALLLFEDRDLA